ncbi:MAG: hypothetical protein K2M42_06050 [Oscillospiraceae bacterium]|nr:hypothetical protein [Oscillospiraceae bacterium]
MARDTMVQDEMEQVENLKKEAQEIPDASVYTRQLKKPFTYENKTVERLDFDFNSLTGTDSIAIEAELNRRMKNLVLPQLSWEFMTLMAVRACTNRDGNDLRVVDEKFLKALPMRDYNAIIGAARNFLLLSDS